MRNLILSKCEKYNLNIDDRCFSILNDDEVTYLVSETRVHKLTHDKVSCCLLLENVAASSSSTTTTASADDRIVSAQLNGLQQWLYLVTERGLIAVYYICMDKSEIIGEVAGGLWAIAVSPDDQLVALVSRQLQLLIMTGAQLQPVADKSLMADETAKFAPVNVGWGSKRTQFHGSAGKAAAVVGDSDDAAAAPTDARDDGRCRLSWRSDALMLCVAYVCPDAGRRRYSVYSREGQLLSRVQLVAGCAGCCVAWQPANQQLIAATLQLPGQQQLQHVVFYEKNGLQHGQFTLKHPPAQAYVRELLWSVCSTVLAVWLDLSDGSCQLQLWTSSNYQWQLKRQLSFPAEQAIAAVAWHPEHQLCLQVVTTDGCWRVYHVQSALFVAADGWSAVVDANTLLATPLARAVLPPPMAALSIHLPATVDCVVLGPPSATTTSSFSVADTAATTTSSFSVADTAAAATRLYAVTDDGCVYVFSDSIPDVASVAGGAATQHVRVVTHVPPTPSDHGHQLQLLGSWKLPAGCAGGWCWAEVAPMLLVACFLSGADDSCGGGGGDGGDGVVAASYCAQLIALQSADNGGCAQVVGRVQLSCAMRLCAPAGDVGRLPTAVFQADDGHIHQLTVRHRPTDAAPAAPTDEASGSHIESVSVSPWHSTALLSAGVVIATPLVQMHVLCGGAGPSPRALLSLCRRRQLRLDQRQLLASCSSFSVGDTYVLATALDHTLHCLPIRLLLEDSASCWSQLAICRRIERGSRLVATPAGATGVLLQMPRGNLELVHPRPLVLARAAILLDSGDYCGAYQLMRRHRLNVNLLVDHCGADFERQCSAICRALAHQPNWLCVLLADLREEDVTKTMYHQWYTLHSGRQASADADANAAAAAAAADAAGDGGGGDYTTYSGRSETSAAAFDDDDTTPTDDGAKINRVCRLVRRCLQQLQLEWDRLGSCSGRSRHQLLLPIVTSWVCQRPADVASALMLIYQISEERNRQPADSASCRHQLSTGANGVDSSPPDSDVTPAPPAAAIAAVEAAAACGGAAGGDGDSTVAAAGGDGVSKYDVATAAAAAVVLTATTSVAAAAADTTTTSITSTTTTTATAAATTTTTGAGGTAAAAPVAGGGAGGDSAEAALRYLLYLVKPERLFDEALGTYNFQLVLMVAEHTDKDPKEYLPFLNELRALAAPYRHYRIDRHLHRHRRALRHLAAAGADHQREALDYIGQHTLYRQALAVYDTGSAGYKAVCGLFADHLATRAAAGVSDSAGSSSCSSSPSSASWWREAGVYYCRAGSQMSAVDAFQRALAWQECLVTATAAGLQGEEFRTLCRSLVAALRAAGRHCDAAAIYGRHLKLVAEQVQCLVAGGSWWHALLVCLESHRSALIESVVRGAVVDAVTSVHGELDDIVGRLEVHGARLHALRHTQATSSQLPDGSADNCDLYSDASSVSTASTSASGRSCRSGRSRRKQERKKYSLRVGSATEDLALVAACHSLAKRCYDLKTGVAELLRVLSWLSLDGPACRLQTHFSRSLASVGGWCRRVWPPAPQLVAQGGAPPPTDPDTVRQYHTLIDRLANIDVQYRQPPLSNASVDWQLASLASAAKSGANCSSPMK